MIYDRRLGDLVFAVEPRPLPLPDPTACPGAVLLLWREDLPEPDVLHAPLRRPTWTSMELSGSGHGATVPREGLTPTDRWSWLTEPSPIEWEGADELGWTSAWVSVPGAADVVRWLIHYRPSSLLPVNGFWHSLVGPGVPDDVYGSVWELKLRATHLARDVRTGVLKP